MPIYKPAEPGEEAFIFNTGICEADLYFTSYIDKNDKPRRPGHRTEEMPFEGFAQSSSHSQTPNFPLGQRHGLTQRCWSVSE